MRFIPIFFILYTLSWGNNIQNDHLEKGINFNKWFNKNFENLEFIKQLKYPWLENFFLVKIVNNKIINNILLHTRNEVFMIFSEILNKLEDFYIFQPSEFNNTPIIFDNIKNTNFLKKNPLTNSFCNIISNKPFLIYYTNEESLNHENYFLRSYFFNNLTVGKKHNQILKLSVANDQIEKFDVFNSILDDYKKRLFLHFLKNTKNLYNMNIGTFLEILGPPLNYTIFNNSSIMLIYGDSAECFQHKEREKIEFIVFFDKNLKFSDINLFTHELCSKCIANHKRSYFSNHKNNNKFKIGQALMGYGKMPSLLMIKNHIFHGKINDGNEYLLKINKCEVFCSKEYALEIVNNIYEKYQNTLPYDLEIYQELLNYLFIGKENIEMQLIDTIFEQNDFMVDEFLPQDKINKKDKN